MVRQELAIESIDNVMPEVTGIGVRAISASTPLTVGFKYHGASRPELVRAGIRIIFKNNT